MLAILIAMMVFGGLAACGGSGSSTKSATTPGTYTFTVRGKGNDASTTTASTRFTVTVN